MKPNVNAVRVKRAVSAYALAKKVGTTPTHIGRIERGECSPAVDLAQRIARALDTNVEALFPFRSAA